MTGSEAENSIIPNTLILVQFGRPLFIIFSSLCIFFYSLAFLVTAGCQLFNCLSSSDSSSDVVFYPNISDVHFESSNATLYPRSNGNHSRFYTVPFSPSGRNCSGIVTSIKHCYWIFNREFTSNVTVFQVVLGNRTHRSFVVTRIITVVSQPQTDICTQVKNNRRVCCDTYELPNHQMFHITSSQFTYGINLLKHQVTFRKNIKYFEVSWFKRNNIVRQGQHVNFNFGMARRSGPMLLLRFSIGKMNTASYNYIHYYIGQRSCLSKMNNSFIVL